MASHRRSARRRVLVVGAFAALAFGAVAGAAFGYWTTSGSGSSVAAVGSPASVTVQAATGTVSQALQPGSSGDLLITVNNPNASALTLQSVAPNGALSVVGGSGCTPANSGVTIPTQTGLTITVPAGTSTVTVPNGAAMSADAASGCQAVRFDIPVTITVVLG